MAFGDQKAIGVAVLTGASIGASNPIAIQTPPVVAVGDLVVALMAQQTALTASGCTDNLGNTYVAQNAGTLSGTTISGRLFYSRVTVPGTLSSVTIAATASANDFSCLCAVFTGPFVTSPVDSSPANGTTDITTPYSCPASATLAQASELVIGWSANNAAATWAASSPFTLTNQTNQANTHAVISHLVTSATTAQTPAFTGTAPTATVLGTLTFKADLNQALTPGKYTDNDTYSGLAPTIAVIGGKEQLAEAVLSPLYKYRLVPVSEEISSPRQQATPPTFALSFATSSSFYRRWRVPDSQAIEAPVAKVVATLQTLTPAQFIDTDTLFTPALSGAITLTLGKYTESDTLFAPVVAPGAIGLTPNKITDNDNVFTTALSLGGVGVAPALISDSDTLFGPNLSVTTTLTPTLFSDSDVFFGPRFGLLLGLFTDSDVFFVPSIGGGAAITPTNFTDSDTLFAPVLSLLKQLGPVFFLDSDLLFSPVIGASNQVSPGRIADSDTLYALSTTLSVTPFHLVDSDTFYGPTLVRAGMLAPSRFIDGDTLFTPAVVGGIPYVAHGSYADASLQVIRARFIPPMSVTMVIARPILGDIRPNRFMDIDTLFSPSIGGGQFIVIPTVYAEGDTLYPPSVTGGSLKRIYNEADSSAIVRNYRYVPPPMSITVVIRGPAPGTQVTPNLFADSDALFNPGFAVGAVNITPSLFIDPDSPRMALVTGGGAQPTMAGRINDADNLFAPGLATGTVNVSPLKFTDTDVFFDPLTGLFVGPAKFTDTDAVFDPVVLAVTDIRPALFVDSDTFFVPLLVASAVNISPFLLTDTDVLSMPGVGSKIDIGSFVDSDTFYSATIVQRNDLFPNKIIDADQLFTPQLVYDQFISAAKINDADMLFEPFFPHDPIYTYPIGHGTLSDYSIRRPRQGRVIIGRH